MKSSPLALLKDTLAVVGVDGATVSGVDAVNARCRVLGSARHTATVQFNEGFAVSCGKPNAQVSFLSAAASDEVNDVAVGFEGNATVAVVRPTTGQLQWATDFGAGSTTTSIALLASTTVAAVVQVPRADQRLLFLGRYGGTQYGRPSAIQRVDFTDAWKPTGVLCGVYGGTGTTTVVTTTTGEYAAFGLQHVSAQTSVHKMKKESIFRSGSIPLASDDRIVQMDLETNLYVRTAGGTVVEVRKGSEPQVIVDRGASALYVRRNVLFIATHVEGATSLHLYSLASKGSVASLGVYDLPQLTRGVHALRVTASAAIAVSQNVATGGVSAKSIPLRSDGQLDAETLTIAPFGTVSSLTTAPLDDVRSLSRHYVRLASLAEPLGSKKKKTVDNDDAAVAEHHEKSVGCAVILSTYTTPTLHRRWAESTEHEARHLQPLLAACASLAYGIAGGQATTAMSTVALVWPDRVLRNALKLAGGSTTRRVLEEACSVTVGSPDFLLIGTAVPNAIGAALSLQEDVGFSVSLPQPLVDDVIEAIRQQQAQRFGSKSQSHAQTLSTVERQLQQYGEALAAIRSLGAPCATTAARWSALLAQQSSTPTSTTVPPDDDSSAPKALDRRAKSTAMRLVHGTSASAAANISGESEQHMATTLLSDLLRALPPSLSTPGSVFAADPNTPAFNHATSTACHLSAYERCSLGMPLN